jgi:hypothetical protein
MKDQLPSHIVEKLAGLPESGYGLHVITVFLRDGRRIPNVHLAWSREIVRVGTHDGPTFDPDDIIDFQLQTIWP